MSINLSTVEAGLVQAVAYADLFDYPLSAPEAHRYLVGVQATRSRVDTVLEGGLLPNRCVKGRRYYFLPGREKTVDTRLQRGSVSSRVWPRAERYGSSLAALPFVRMVAVSGALAMDNMEPNTDIDYLIVTESGRLWLCRALVIALVRWAAQRGDIVCPNYFLSESALVLQQRNLFTAHEIAQMVPIAGLDIYRRLRQLNGWIAEFLPNALDAPRRAEARQIASSPSHRRRSAGDYPRLALERFLRTPPGDWLERWEMARKVRKFSRRGEENQRFGCAGSEDEELETGFTPDRCKGHFDSHGQRTLSAFAERMNSLALTLPLAVEAAGEQKMVAFEGFS